MPNADDYLDLLKASVADLPAVNLAMLEMLVDLMQLITANSDKNKMSTEVGGDARMAILWHL